MELNTEFTSADTLVDKLVLNIKILNTSKYCYIIL